MTTIITRLYKDLETVRGVVAALADEGHDAATIGVIGRDGDMPVAERMARARVPSAAAAVYGPHIDSGAALLVVRAPFAPMGTARNAIEVVNRTAAIDVGLANEDAYIREEVRVETSGKVLPGTVFYMSNPLRKAGHGHILGANPLRPSRPRTSAIRGGAHMSTKFWPMKLVSAPKEGRSAIRGGFLFSSIFGLPTVIRDWDLREMIPTKV